MWEPDGEAGDPEALGPLRPVEVLSEFEGEALTYVALDRNEVPLLVHNLCVFERTSRYVVAAITPGILTDLKAGRVDVRTALRQPRCWIADLVASDSDDPPWRVKAIHVVEFEDLPDAYLPCLGAMLTPELKSSYENISF